MLVILEYMQEMQVMQALQVMQVMQVRIAAKKLFRNFSFLRGEGGCFRTLEGGSRVLNPADKNKWAEGGAQWAKSGGEAVLWQFSDSTKDPMHDFNRLFCWNSSDCEFWPYIMYLLEY